MDKKEIAQALEEIGTLLELKGENPYKVIAYHNAARALEGMSDDLGALVKEQRLREIPGVGEALSEKITELFKTGKLKYWEDLKKSFPPGLPEVLKIPGMGPRKVKALFDKLAISGLGELEYACKENRLVDLPGFGIKTQENILKGIASLNKNQGAFLFDAAFEAGERILDQVQKMRGVVKACIAGSLRRRKEIIHDVDVLVAAKSGVEKIMADFTRLKGVESVLAQGETKSSVRLSSGLQVDLRIVEEREYPFALLYFTGSKEHNTLLRGLAKDRGLKLNEYGLFRGTKSLTCRDEEAIFKALGLHYIPPELREAMEEIDWAAKEKFPELVEAEDIKGVFHSHSTYSDGTADIETMAKAAQKLGFQYMGLSDHSRTAAYAGGLSVADIKKQHREIDALNQKLKGFKILKGIESDILPDGSLDYPEEILKKFDFIIASVHAAFTMSEAEMTRRLIKALENPYTTMLGHLTGRLLLGREGYSFNLDRIIETAARHKKVIEINANPHRFDMDWRHLRRTAGKGVRFSINPDAHSPEGLKDTFYGVGIARKGWLTPKDVINTMPLGQIESFLAKAAPLS